MSEWTVRKGGRGTQVPVTRSWEQNPEATKLLRTSRSFIMSRRSRHRRMRSPRRSTYSSTSRPTLAHLFAAARRHASPCGMTSFPIPSPAMTATLSGACGSRGMLSRLGSKGSDCSREVAWEGVVSIDRVEALSILSVQSEGRAMDELCSCDRCHRAGTNGPEGGSS